MRVRLLHSYMGHKAGTVLEVSRCIGEALLRDKAAEPAREHKPANKRASVGVKK
jgi:hypothetical protein